MLLVQSLLESIENELEKGSMDWPTNFGLNVESFAN
jgi:hypothetical protein